MYEIVNACRKFISVKMHGRETLGLFYMVKLIILLTS